MSHLFTLQEFYKVYFPNDLAKQCIILPQVGHFNVFKRGQFCKHLTQIHRSDFYKISLIIGTGILHLEDRKIEVNGRALVFYNPSVPHLWENVSPQQDGFFCLFNREFIKSSAVENVFRSSPLFNVNMNPVYHLTKEQADDLMFIYNKMLMEVEANYTRKYEVIHNYLQLIIHEYNKNQPLYLTSEKYVNASSRIASLFIELLERQFPVDSTERSLKLKTPHDFAERLSVHVNHLNRAVKEITGRSTSEIIAARIAAEAETLLLNTDNTVAEIAYSLGFEHPSNFNIFFKKQTETTPKTIRAGAVRAQSIAS
ncbi:helix-turn-helix domain-containing protein [Chryseosolibacter indicus]|uniref:AraC family transcriptional regulator n=1 Tax=Chryseosolibacter indicus TaxID=2782351 RepID=A0ABS5VVQ6_9BACT|nr:helix-turn-helix domain-containing protein [Chryseosolibacter indicus]MBT1705525.1 AraC family transcriptional regulator [Chryseosolibacter indicus]